MAERPVIVGVFPEVVVLDPGDQVTWICDAGNLRIEFDVNRCPFGSNVFQAPIGMRLQTGPPRPGTKVPWRTKPVHSADSDSALYRHEYARLDFDAVILRMALLVCVCLGKNS